MLNTLIACKHLQPNQLHDETEVRGYLLGQTADGSKLCVTEPVMSVSSHICIILAVANSLVTMVEFLNFWYIPRKITICAPVFACTGGEKVSSTSHPSLPSPELAIINPRAWIMDVNESLTGRMRLQKSTGPIRWGEDVSLGTKMGFCQPLCLSHSTVRAHNFSHSHTGMTYWVRLWWKAAAPARTGLRWQNSQYRILILFIVFANTYPLKYALISLHHRFLESARDITDCTTERE